MNVRFYDAHMDFLGEMEDAISVIWTRRYQEPGEFQITAPITPNNLAFCRRGIFVHLRGAAEAGIVEHIRLEESEDETTIELTGRMAEALLDRRVIRGKPYSFSGAAERAMREILQDMTPLFSAEDGIGFLVSGLEGETPIRFQATYRRVLAYIERLAQFLSCGFRMRPDFSAKRFTFEPYRGQNLAGAVIFSDRYDNMTGAIWEEDDEAYRNVIYVGGEGEGEDRVFVTAGDATLTGLARREAALSAPESRGEDVTLADYAEQLRQAGESALASEYGLSLTMECETEAESSFVYGKDYDLGDIVTVRKAEWGVSESLRLTEITEVWEDGIRGLTVTLGDPLPQSVVWDDYD